MFIRNQAVTGFTFLLVNKTDGNPVTTGTVTGYYTLDGGTQGAIAGTPVHEGNGQWSVDLTAGEMDGAVVGLLFTHASAIPVQFTIKTDVNRPTLAEIEASTVLAKVENLGAIHMPLMLDKFFNLYGWEGGGTVTVQAVNGLSATAGIIRLKACYPTVGALGNINLGNPAATKVLGEFNIATGVWTKDAGWTADEYWDQLQVELVGTRTGFTPGRLRITVDDYTKAGRVFDIEIPFTGSPPQDGYYVMNNLKLAIWNGTTAQEINPASAGGATLGEIEGSTVLAKYEHTAWLREIIVRSQLVGGDTVGPANFSLERISGSLGSATVTVYGSDDTGYNPETTSFWMDDLTFGVLTNSGWTPDGSFVGGRNVRCYGIYTNLALTEEVRIRMKGSDGTNVSEFVLPIGGPHYFLLGKNGNLYIGDRLNSLADVKMVHASASPGASLAEIEASTVLAKQHIKSVVPSSRVVNTGVETGTFPDDLGQADWNYRITSDGAGAYDVEYNWGMAPTNTIPVGHIPLGIKVRLTVSGFPTEDVDLSLWNYETNQYNLIKNVIAVSTDGYYTDFYIPLKAPYVVLDASADGTSDAVRLNISGVAEGPSRNVYIDLVLLDCYDFTLGNVFPYPALSQNADITAPASHSVRGASLSDIEGSALLLKAQTSGQNAVAVDATGNPWVKNHTGQSLMPWTEAMNEWEYAFLLKFGRAMDGWTGNNAIVGWKSGGNPITAGSITVKRGDYDGTIRSTLGVFDSSGWTKDAGWTTGQNGWADLVYLQFSTDLTMTGPDTILFQVNTETAGYGDPTNRLNVEIPVPKITQWQGSTNPLMVLRDGSILQANYNGLSRVTGFGKDAGLLLSDVEGSTVLAKEATAVAVWKQTIRRHGIPLYQWRQDDTITATFTGTLTGEIQVLGMNVGATPVADFGSSLLVGDMDNGKVWTKSSFGFNQDRDVMVLYLTGITGDGIFTLTRTVSGKVNIFNIPVVAGTVGWYLVSDTGKLRYGGNTGLSPLVLFLNALEEDKGVTGDVNLVSIGGNPVDDNTAILKLRTLDIANTDGPAIRAIGGLSYPGIMAQGGETGHGAEILGGPTSGDGIRVNAPTDGVGMRVAGSGNNSGLKVDGAGSGAGVDITPGATGVGAKVRGGGTSGDGVDISTTDGHGVKVAAAGAGKADIKATKEIGITNITYNPDNTYNQITLSDGRVISFTYSSGKLIAVGYA